MDLAKKMLHVVPKFLLALAIFWAIFLAVYAFGVGSYSTMLVRISAIAPIYLTGIMAASYVARYSERSNIKETFVLLALLVGPVFILALLTETYFIYMLGLPEEGVGYFEMLFAPLSRRYTIVLFWDMTFSQIAVMSAAFAVLVTFLGKVSRRVSRPS